MTEKTKCRNPKCDRDATEEYTSAGDLCEPCYDAYMLGQNVGKTWMSGYMSGGDPAAARYSFWKE